MEKHTAPSPTRIPTPARSTSAPQAPGQLPTRLVPHRHPGPPAPIEPFTVVHPDLPASLDGLTILHVSDLHVRRRRPSRGSGDRSSWGRLLHAVEQTPADLVAYTGDFMDDPGHEAHALDALGRLVQAAASTRPPRLGQWAVFGNHDSPAFRQAAVHIPGLRWLDNELTSPLTDTAGHATALRVLGLSWPEDPLAALLDAPAPGSAGEFTLTLAHYPSVLVTLAAMRVPLVLAGHTHGGQVRPHRALIPHTSSDLPPTMGCGLLRLGQTLCAISRGAGEGYMDGLRVNCPPQVPLYTLRRGPLAGPSEGVCVVTRW